MSLWVHFREFHLSETKARRIRGDKPLRLCELAIFVTKKKKKKKKNEKTKILPLKRVHEIPAVGYN